MAFPCDLNRYQETGSFATRPCDETDKIAIAADVRLFPCLEKAGNIADLWRYGDAICHVAKL